MGTTVLERREEGKVVESEWKELKIKSSSDLRGLPSFTMKRMPKPLGRFCRERREDIDPG